MGYFYFVAPSREDNPAHLQSGHPVAFMASFTFRPNAPTRTDVWHTPPTNPPRMTIPCKNHFFTTNVWHISTTIKAQPKIHILAKMKPAQRRTRDKGAPTLGEKRSAMGTGLPGSRYFCKCSLFGARALVMQPRVYERREDEHVCRTQSTEPAPVGH